MTPNPDDDQDPSVADQSFAEAVEGRRDHHGRCGGDNSKGLKLSKQESITVREQVEGVFVQATAVPGMEPLLRGVVDVFAEKRSEWRDGFNIWMGWGPLVLSSRDDEFVITSPDYSDNPREMTDDLSSALWITNGMISTLDATGADPMEVQFHDEILVCKGWQESKSLLVTRDDPDGFNSGWFVQPYPVVIEGDWPVEDMKNLYLFKAVQLRPVLARILALPPGTEVVIEDTSVKIVVRGSDRKVLAHDI